MRGRILVGFVALFLVALSFSAGPAGAADVTLNAVLFPDGEKTDITFVTGDRAPKAKLTATVKPEQAQSQIEIDWSKLEPALLFGGDVNCWVLWAVTPDGTAQAMGELPVRDDRSGNARFSSPFKQFALMVTAEPFPVVRRPSDIVVFTSAPAKSKMAKNSTFTYGTFRPTKRDVESIATLKYKDKTPVELQQARKAVELMDRFEAEKYAQAATRDARVALGQADDALEGRVGKKSDVPELSRRAIALSNQAVMTAVKQIEAQQAKDAEAQRLSELAQKQAETEAERAARMKTEADLADVERQRTALTAEVARVQAEKAKVEADKAQIQAERDALASRLGGALGKVAATEKTGRGLVVSLSGGILFETGKSALKNDAKVSLAKLSGILLMIPNTNIMVEGHTDSTGTEETNNKLSQARASAVMDFMKMQGVDASRMNAKGLAATQPVAPNETADGRAKNRRVEIIVPQ